MLNFFFIFFICRFNKNRYWKKKYQPRSNASAIVKLKPSQSKHEKSNDQSEGESENEFELKQPLPKDGWFPEFESLSSDSENYDSIKNVQQFNSKSSFDSDNDNLSYKSWFDRELDVSYDLFTKKNIL